VYLKNISKSYGQLLMMFKEELNNACMQAEID